MTKEQLINKANQYTIFRFMRFFDIAFVILILLKITGLVDLSILIIISPYILAALIGFFVAMHVVYLEIKFILSKSELLLTALNQYNAISYQNNISQDLEEVGEEKERVDLHEIDNLIRSIQFFKTMD